MKFAVTSEHRDFFNAHNAIEFDELLTASQLKELQDSIASLFSPKTTSDKQFALGRDLWKQHAGIRKIVTHLRLAKLVAELNDQKTLRLGFDNYIPAPDIPRDADTIVDSYHQLLREARPLNSHSSLQGIVCGLMLCLKGSGEKQEDKSAFATQPGNGVFLKPDYLIEYPKLFDLRNHAYLLIVYTVANAVYIRQEDDPHTLTFKETGYAIGDKLKDKWNPIILRP